MLLFQDIWKGDSNGRVVGLKALRVFTEAVNDSEKVLKVGISFFSFSIHNKLNPQKSFSQEAVVWRQLRHPNVLPFYGISEDAFEVPRLCLVSPWMNNGNIMSYLEAQPDHDRLTSVGVVLWTTFRD
jgi:serine/threonine protein kinase